MKYFDPKNYPKQAVNKVTIAANIITLSGSTTNGHTANITINGVLNTAGLSYLTSTTVTAAAWCLANYNFYKLKGFLVTAAAGIITVNPAHSWDTTNRINATIATVTGTLTGTLTGTFTLDGSKAKLWEVTFTTASGVIAAPVNMKDADSVQMMLVSTSTTAITSASTVYLDGLSLATVALTTSPYIAEGIYDSVSGRLIMHSTTNGVFVKTSTGMRLYGMLEITGQAGATLKVHAHNIAASTEATVEERQLYANEFKGEFLGVDGTMDGIAAHYHMKASGSGIMRSVLGVAYLDAGVTLTGTDYTSNGWLNAGTFVADVAGTIAGTETVVAGLYAGIGSCQTGTLTSCKYLTSLYVTSNRLTTLSAGQSSLILATNPAGTDKKAVQYGLRMESGSLIGNAISLQGTYTSDVIDLSGVTYIPTGSAGPCLLRAGTYDIPLANSSADQSGLIRLYMQTSGNGASYDRAIFSCLKTTGTKGAISTAGLVELLATGGAGPMNVKGCEFIVDLHATGAKLPASAIAYGGWFKVTAIDGATIDATAKVAPLWLDNQLYGANASGCLEYTIWNTTGGTVPKAWAGFGTTSAGWANLLYFDATMAAQAPIVTSFAGNGAWVPGNKGTFTQCGQLKILIGTNQYYIPYGTVA